MKNAKSVKTSKEPAPAKARKARPAAAWNPAWFDIGVLIVLVVVCYSNALHGQFVFDDQQIVIQNPVVQHIDNWGDAMRAGGGWRQLLFLTYGLNFLWSGLDPYSYHVGNILIHIINVILIYFILLRLAPPNRARTAALAGAAVFAAHTLFSAGVVYITARSSTLCATFYFGAILLFLKGFHFKPALDLAREGRYGAAGGQFLLGIRWIVLAAVCGLLAWQTKQEAISLPVFLAGFVWLRSEKKDWRIIAVLAAIPLATVWILRDQLKSIYTAAGKNDILVAAGFDTVLAPAEYFRTYVTAIFEYYLPRFVLPVWLSADPHIRAVGQWYSLEFLAAMLVLAGLAFIMIRMAGREPLLSAGLAAILLSPLTAYAVVPLADPVLEYRAYIPGLGLALVAGWTALRVPWYAVAGFVLLLGAMTFSRNRVWDTPVTLWEDAVLKSPEKARTHFNLGASYQNAGRNQDALAQYKRALELKPDIYAAYSNMSAILVDNQQWDEAEKTLVKVTGLSPKYTEAWINLAVLYLRLKQTDKAITAARQAVKTNGSSFAAEYNLAEALTQNGFSRKISDPDPAVAEKEKLAQKSDFLEAIEHYKSAVDLRLDMTAFRLTLGQAYLRAGDRDGAIKVWQGVTELPPPTDRNAHDYACDAYRRWAAMVSEAGDLDKAFALIKQALVRCPFLPDGHHDLGLIYDKKQQYSLAAEEFKAALAQQPSHGPAALNLAMEYSEHLGNRAEAKAVLQRFVALPEVQQPQSPYFVNFQTAQQRLGAMP